MRPEESTSEDISHYLTFIIPRILFVLNPTFGVADSRNTEFAIWCAKLASRKVRIIR